MLLELINHYHNLHFSIGFSNVAAEAPHFHNETEIVLVLRGSVKYKIFHQDYSIKEGDIIIVDARDLHYIYESSDDVILLTSYIDMDHFTDIYPNIDFMIFACEEFGADMSAGHQKIQNKIAFIAHNLAEMMLLTLEDGTEDRVLSEKLLDIINTMVNHLQGFFIENNEFQYGGDTTQLNLERLTRIMSYLYANHDKNVTLNDIAELEHLSMYHVSHLIKETTGLNFQKLLNYIRLENSEKLLNNDKLTLTQISEACGFSSTTYFNKCFKEWYHMTPAQYRKRPRPAERTFHGEPDMAEAISLLTTYVNAEFPKAHHDGERSVPEPVVIRPDEISQCEHQPFCPLTIEICSVEELQMLICYKDEIAALSPGSVRISEKLSEIPGFEHIIYALRSDFCISPLETEYACSSHRHSATPAEAFTQIEQNSNIKLCGALDSGALLNPAGLPTPYYMIYKMLAGVRTDSSCRVFSDVSKQFTIIKSKDMFSVISYNTDSVQSKKFKMEFDGPAVRRTLTRDKCYRDISDAAMRKFAFEAACGNVDLMPSGIQDVNVAPGEVIVTMFPI